MQSTRITLDDRRRAADKTAIRWRLMLATAVLGLVAALVVWITGDPRSRADEATVLVVTLLVIGLTPLLEWILRFVFARSSTLSDRLEEANGEVARLSAENARLNGALRIEDFAAEAAEFDGLSAPFWDRLERAFGQWSVAAVPARIRSLRELVDTANWPDRIERKPVTLVGPHHIGQPTTVDEVLLEFASCVYPQYGFELIPKDAFPAFDLLRRNVRRRMRQWGERLQSAQREEVRGWLSTRIGPSHAGTIKMAWYLDVANAERAAVKTPVEDAHYRAVRDALAARSGASGH